MSPGKTFNYSAVARYADEYLEAALPEPVDLGEGKPIPSYPVAVYVAVGLSGEVLYVGSVCRPDDPAGVASRMEEHLRKLDRLQTWAQLYVVPLRADTPLTTVRRIEGRIGAHLAPVMNRALPRIGSRRRSGGA